jgi:hypothetical protein
MNGVRPLFSLNCLIPMGFKVPTSMEIMLEVLDLDNVSKLLALYPFTKHF